MNHKRIHFSAKNSETQFFSIPKPIIRYICKNPKPSPTLLYKLYFTCKFFYPKIKIIGVNRIEILHNCREITWRLGKSPERYERLPLPLNTIYNIDFKFCCTRSYIYLDSTIEPLGSVDPKLTSYVLTKLWHFNSCRIVVVDQILTLKEYKIMAETTKELLLHNITVFSDNGFKVPCETLFKFSPNVDEFKFSYRSKSSFTDQTAQALAKIDRNIKLVYFYIDFVPPSFDPVSFVTFIKKNMSRESKSTVDVQFDDDVTKEEEENFEKILKSPFASPEYEKININIYFRNE